MNEYPVLIAQTIKSWACSILSANKEQIKKGFGQILILININRKNANEINHINWNDSFRIY